MAFKRAKARIGERSTTSGSGPWMLAGAFDASYHAFSTFLSDGDSTEITVVEPGVAAWTGIGTYTAADNSIAPTTVEETWGTFGTGTKEIFAGSLASRHLVRDDMSGALGTAGTSTAYTVNSFAGYATLAQLANRPIAFTPHTTSGAGPVTLSVDGLTAKPIRMSPNKDLPTGVLVQGTPYLTLYNNTDGAFYLHGMTDSPWMVPLGVGFEYWANGVPNSYFVNPAGQAISRTVYAPLFNLVGTQFGSGDGSTTFNVQDKTGRVSAMKEAVATRLTSGGGGVDGATLGAAGGAQTRQLITGNLPAYTPAGSVSAPTLTIQYNAYSRGSSPLGVVQPNSLTVAMSGSDSNIGNNSPATATASAPTFTGTAQGGSSTAFGIVLPLIISGYIMRVL